MSDEFDGTLDYEERARRENARTRPRAITHWVRWDDVGIRWRHALCGLLIRASEHSNDPTCPTCAKILAEHEATEP